jgi:hypothetical protein
MLKSEPMLKSDRLGLFGVPVPMSFAVKLLRKILISPFTVLVKQELAYRYSKQGFYTVLRHTTTVS